MSKSKKAYAQIWNSPMAELVDLGASTALDEFYQVFLASQHFQDRDSSELLVIDLGAGKGSRLAQLLSERGAQVIAVDFVYDALDVELRYPARKVASDVLETQLESDSADVVISANVTINNSSLATDPLKRRYLSEIRRLLKPGGIFWGEEKDIDPALVAELKHISELKFFADAYIHSFVKQAS